MSSNSKQSRSAMPYCLALLVLIAAAYVCLQAHRERSAIQSLREIRAEVRTTPTGPAWLRSVVGNESLDGFDHASAVFMMNDGTTDTDLESLRRTPDVQEIMILSTDVTDAGMLHLAGLRRIRSLVALLS